jgi:hypothetical protein
MSVNISPGGTLEAPDDGTPLIHSGKVGSLWFYALVADVSKRPKLNPTCRGQTSLHALNGLFLRINLALGRNVYVTTTPRHFGSECLPRCKFGVAQPLYYQLGRTSTAFYHR